MSIKTRKGWFFILLLFFLNSCSEKYDLLEITIPTEASADSITLHFEIADTVSVKSYSPLGAGRYVNVYAYRSPAALYGTPIAVSKYRTSSSGLLSPVGNAMKLIEGRYDFYVVATNSLTDDLPVITGTWSNPLSDKTDYLWDRISGVNVTRKMGSIPFYLLRCCTKISIDIQESLFTFIWGVRWVKIIAPGGTQRLNLLDGTINPSIYPGTSLIDMNLTNTVSSAILLPYAGRSPLKVYFSVWTNFNYDYKTYEVELFPPGGSFRAGVSYRYKAIIEDDVLSFVEIAQDSVRYIK